MDCEVVGELCDIVLQDEPSVNHQPAPHGWRSHFRFSKNKNVHISLFCCTCGGFFSPVFNLVSSSADCPTLAVLLNVIFSDTWEPPADHQMVACHFDVALRPHCTENQSFLFSTVSLWDVFVLRKVDTFLINQCRGDRCERELTFVPFGSGGSSGDLTPSTRK